VLRLILAGVCFLQNLNAAKKKLNPEDLPSQAENSLNSGSTCFGHLIFGFRCFRNPFDRKIIVCFDAPLPRRLFGFTAVANQPFF
jgi:hypothetical protein